MIDKQMTFAERLKKIRQEKELTQTALAEKIGVHYTQIGRYENKGAHPTGDILGKLAYALNVSADYLMNGSTDQNAAEILADRELLAQFREVEKLEDEDKKVIKIFLNAFLVKKQLMKMI